jgi:hypothetical protein
MTCGNGAGVLAATAGGGHGIGVFSAAQTGGSDVEPFSAVADGVELPAGGGSFVAT